VRHSVYLCGLALVAAGVGVLAVSQVGIPSSSARVATEVVTAEDGVVQTTVTGTGNVAAGTDDEVDFATSGTLRHVYVHEGERVTKGQVLAKLDPTSAQLTLDQANATLTAAEDTLAEAEDGSSSSSGTTTTTSTTDATTLDEDQIAVETAEQSVKSDELALDATTLRAPASGAIASLEDLFPGDSVQAGSSSGGSSSSSSSSSSGSASSSSSSSSSSSFAEIVNTSTLTMTVAISEGDIGEIKVGQPATVTMDALTGVELAAHVAAISADATDSSDVVSYNVTLNLDQTDSRVLSGMSGSAVVIVDQAAGVTVPTAAVTGSGSDGTVTLDQDGTQVQRQVVVGLRGTSRAEITSGLKAGDELVITEALPSSRSSGTTTAGTGLSGAL
jgi:multidrug efflux pump subunit AcrA (membrane-fusion protein)